ncbi:MAG: M20/M25/M40 family metallo-hydrolase [Pseudomonadota bacterium]
MNRSAFAFAIALMSSTTVFAAEKTDWQNYFVKSYAENVAIETAGSKNTLKLAQTIAARMKAAGFPEKDLEVIDTGDGKGIIFARLHGAATSEAEKLPPIVFMAHSDTVPVKLEDWKIKNEKGELITLDPFKLTKIDGKAYEISEETDSSGNKKEATKELGEGVGAKYFGRGVNDDKGMLTMIETSFTRLAAEGYKGKRDYIMIFAPDEETGDATRQGIGYVFDKRPELIKGAELLINEGGTGKIKYGKTLNLEAQVAEKVGVTYILKATGVSRHSSQPGPADTNPIYTLAQAFVNVSKLEFPIMLTPVTKNYFEKIEPNEAPEMQASIQALLAGKTDKAELATLLADTYYNGQVRNTCVATMSEPGIAQNVVPGSATGKVNCRVLPGTPVDDVTAALTKAIDNPAVTITMASKPVFSDPSPVDPILFEIAAKIVKKNFGENVPFMASMSNGATDMIDFRNEGYLSYGINFFPLGERISNMHGNNEWVGAEDMNRANETLYEFMAELANTKLSGVKQPEHKEQL